MSKVVGFVVVVFSIAVVACAIDPRDDPERISDDSQETPVADPLSEVAMMDSQETEFSNPFDTVDGEAAAATCPLEVVEPCISLVAICAVRCCDNSLFKSPQICGNCGTWAKGACLDHGTIKRIRWER